MQIRSLRRCFLACQHWFLDSTYQITPNQGIKPFSSQNACICYFSEFFPDYKQIEKGVLRLKFTFRIRHHTNVFG